MPSDPGSRVGSFPDYGDEDVLSKLSALSMASLYVSDYNFHHSQIASPLLAGVSGTWEGLNETKQHCMCFLGGVGPVDIGP